MANEKPTPPTVGPLGHAFVLLDTESLGCGKCVDYDPDARSWLRCGQPREAHEPESGGDCEAPVWSSIVAQHLPCGRCDRCLGKPTPAPESAEPPKHVWICDPRGGNDSCSCGWTGNTKSWRAHAAHARLRGETTLEGVGFPAPARPDPAPSPEREAPDPLREALDAGRRHRFALGEWELYSKEPESLSVGQLNWAVRALREERYQLRLKLQAAGQPEREALLAARKALRRLADSQDRLEIARHALSLIEGLKL